MNHHNPLATILKIMTHFVQDMGETAELRLHGSPLVDELVRKGFRPEDIATAMRCLGVMAIQSGQGGNPPRPGNRGHQSPPHPVATTMAATRAAVDTATSAPTPDQGPDAPPKPHPTTARPSGHPTADLARAADPHLGPDADPIPGRDLGCDIDSTSDPAPADDPRQTPFPDAAPSPTPTDPGEMRAVGLRQLHAAEAIRLSPEAQQLLLGLLEAGQISPLHFERTIEYIWKSDLREVTASRLQLLLYMNDPTPNRGGAPFLSDRITKPDFIN